MSQVDVVIPCYNYGRYLDDCVHSVLGQAGVDVRVLIIDDASTDETPVVGQRIARDNARVEFIRHPDNCGHIATYNEGLLDWCRGEYSLLLSADDILADGALARAVEILDRHLDIHLVYGIANSFTGEISAATLNARLRAEPPIDGEPYRVVPSEEFLRYCFYRGNPVPTPTAVVRTATQKQLGGYLLELPHSGDMEMWMRFAVEGPVAFIRRVQAHYRLHANNMTYSYSSRAIGDRREVIAAIQIAANRGRGRFVHLDQWTRDLHARFASEALTHASAALDEGDWARYRACLDFAEEMAPGAVHTLAGIKLRLKSVLGPRLAALASRVVSFLSSSRTSCADARNATPLTHSRSSLDQGNAPSSISGFRQLVSV